MLNVSIENELNNVNKDFVDNDINNVDTIPNNDVENTEISNEIFDNNTSLSIEKINISPTLNNEIDIENECTSLVVVKDNKLFVAQKMFKKSIKISIKSFLISLSLGFLNLFL